MNNFFGKIKHSSEKLTDTIKEKVKSENFSKVTNKIPGSNVVNKIKNIGSNNSDNAMNEIRNQINSLQNEKIKMFEFIGMEVYDLYTAGEVNLQQIEIFYSKLENINSELSRLEEEKNDLLSINDIKKCSCGYVLKEDVKFCPECGTNTLNYNSMIEKKEMLAITNEQKNVIAEIECVCGAIVSTEQIMCLECGRKVEV